jgi:hypothetical protein
MTEPIAVCTDYESLLVALRARADALNVSRATLDDVSGLASGYTAKLLAQPPIKSLGAVSLGPMLGALGIAIVLVEDPDAMRRVASRMVGRNNSQVRVLTGGKHNGITIKLSLRHMKKLAKLATAARKAKIPRWRRIKIAKQAARARWKRSKRAAVPTAEPGARLELQSGQSQPA